MSAETARSGALRRIGRWLTRGLLVVVGLHAVLVGAIFAIMLQPPERFGRIIRHLPMPIVWGLVPGPLPAAATTSG